METLSHRNEGKGIAMRIFNTAIALMCLFHLAFVALVNADTAQQPGPIPSESASVATGAPAPVDPAAASPTATAATEDSSGEPVQQSILLANFTYRPAKLNDPFLPFISHLESPTPQLSLDDEGPAPPAAQKPLTPLQKMSVGELEKGLKAIMWGDMGRRAIIEDSSGKGYIVTIGTPCGDKNGIIAQIFNDRLVIQQESWNKEEKRMAPENSVVKLRKDKKE